MQLNKSEIDVFESLLFIRFYLIFILFDIYFIWYCTFLKKNIFEEII